MILFLLTVSTVIWSRHAMVLSPTGNRGRCVTRPNNGCEGEYSKRGTDTSYFAQKWLDNRDHTPQNTDLKERGRSYVHAFMVCLFC